MPKRPLHILSLISAVVCVLSLMLVVRSFFHSFAIWVPVGSNAYWAMTLDGQLALGLEGDVHTGLHLTIAHAAAQRNWFDMLWSRQLTGIRWLRIGWGTTAAYSGPIRILILPFWLLPILTAILPLRWWLIRRRRGGRGFLPVEAKPPTGGAA